MLGDFNAGTGVLLDFIEECGNLNEMYQLDCEMDEFNMSRSSRDYVVNNFGRSLIELCYKNHVHIVNGRFPGDAAGNNTCCTNNGVSVVDYVILSSSLFHYIRDFSVDTIDVSDHFPIQCTLQFSFVNAEMSGNNNISDNLQVWKKCKWKPDLLLEFTNKLHDEIRQHLPNFQQSIQQFDTQKAVVLTDMLLRAGTGMISGKNKCHKTDNANNASWWDKECGVLRKRKFELLNSYRESNNVFELRNYIEIRNQFKSMCKKKARKYKLKQRNMLLHSTQDNFWRVVKEIKGWKVGVSLATLLVITRVVQTTGLA